MLSLLTTAFLLLPATPQEPAPCCQEPAKVVQNSATHEAQCSETSKSNGECPHPMPATAAKSACTNSQLDAALANLNVKLKAKSCAPSACSDDQEPVKAHKAMQNRMVVLSSKTQGLEACCTQEPDCDVSKLAGVSATASVGQLAQLGYVGNDCSDCDVSKLASVTTTCDVSKLANVGECSDCDVSKLASVTSTCDVSKLANVGECSDCDVSKLASITSTCDVSKLANVGECSDCDVSKLASLTTTCDVSKLANVGECSDCDVSKLAQVVVLQDATKGKSDCCSQQAEGCSDPAACADMADCDMADCDMADCDMDMQKIAKIDAEIETLIRELESEEVRQTVVEVVAIQEPTTNRKAQRIQRRIANIENRLDRIEQLLTELAEKL